MTMKKQVLFWVAATACALSLPAQQPLSRPPQGGGAFEMPATDRCLDSADHARIWAEIRQNVRDLERAGTLPAAQPEQIVSFSWPLQAAPGLNYFNYYGISNFVDHDNSSGLLDYNCDTRTYNGHQGTDIFTWPFPWYLYDNNAVQVIAGATGTIVSKFDGQDDNHCSCSGSWNAVYVQHADGSIAWYGHLKKNSLTNKSVGQTVAKGEYLGIVASSGCSTGPHLHLEVYDNANHLIDPYAGACNGLNSISWWAAQPDYREPTVNAVFTHDAAPVHGCPGTNENPHFDDHFSPTQTIFMAAYYKDQLSGDVSTYRIRKPDNSIWASWTHTSPATFNASWWYWTWTLPSNGPFGTWTFEVEYYGQTFAHTFTYFDPLPVEWLDFTARRLGAASIGLNWTTGSEHGNAGFFVEHSSDGTQWASLGFVESLSADAPNPHQYQFVHHQAPQTLNYYRLQQLDWSGDIEFSPIVQVLPVAAAGALYPNPTTGQVQLPGWEGLPLEADIYSATGQLLGRLSAETGLLDLSRFERGVYFLGVSTNGQRRFWRVLRE